MIRVVIYLVIVGLLAAATVWLADRPGDVMITWQNRRIETSVMVLAVAVAAIAVFTVMLWTILRAIVRSPDTLRFYLRMRRGMRGYHAVSQGLVAVGSGDVRTARRLAEEAARIAPNEPLTLLLTAQASQLSGDRDAAERTFHAMASRDDTRLLGLHGLYIEAQRRNDGAAAKLYAEEAAAGARAPAWAGLAVFDARCATGDWIGALERLDRNMKSGLVDRELVSAPARRAAHRARARIRCRRRSRRRPRAGARSGEVRAHAGAGGRAGGPAAGRCRRPPPRRAHRRGGVESQSASRSRRGLRASAIRRFRARPARARRVAGGQDAGQCRRRAGGGARRARRAGIREPRAARWRRSRSRRASASRC